MSDPTPPRRPAFGAAKPPPVPPPPPAFEVVEDDEFEVVDDPAEVAPARNPVRAEPATGATTRRPLRAEAADADGDGPRPKPKKKKPKRVVVADDDGQADRDRALAEFEWYWPAAILVIGVAMCLIGGIGAAGAIGLVHTVGVLVIGLTVSIPLSVGALMAIGILAGIEYGRFGPGVLKLAAITCVANGVMLVGAWLKLPFFVYLPVSGLITLGLFMTQFELDMGEANASVGAINLFSFLANMLLLGFLVAGAAKSGGGKDEYPDEGGADDDPPAAVEPEFRPKKGKQRPPAKTTRPADPAGDGRDDE